MQRCTFLYMHAPVPPCPCAHAYMLSWSCVLTIGTYAHAMLISPPWHATMPPAHAMSAISLGFPIDHTHLSTLVVPTYFHIVTHFFYQKFDMGGILWYVPFFFRNIMILRQEQWETVGTMKWRPHHHIFHDLKIPRPREVTIPNLKQLFHTLIEKLLWSILLQYS